MAKHIINFLQLHIDFDTNSDNIREAIESSIINLGFELEHIDANVYIFSLYDFESFQHTAESIKEELTNFKDVLFEVTLFHFQQVTSTVVSW